MAYENQYIGVFIYSLGIIAGRRALPISDSINLLQQTPADKTFGDLLMQWQGKNFIIEFKRNEMGLATELKKPKRERLINEINKGNKALGLASIKSHFVGYAISEVVLVFKRYVLFNFSQEPAIDFESFVNALSDPQSQVGITDPKEFESYVRYLIKAADGDDVSGIIVNASSGGGFNFIVYNSYRELNQKIRLVKDLSITQSNQNTKRQKPGFGFSR
jgi:hypothetical protein